MNGAKRAAVALCAFAATAAAAPVDPSGGGKWINFYSLESPTGTWYQLDTTSIAKNGPYTMFWVRIWNIALGSPTMARDENGQEVELHAKKVIDCADRKDGASWLDFNDPAQRAKATTMENMAWVELKDPDLLRIICGIE